MSPRLGDKSPGTETIPRVELIPEHLLGHETAIIEETIGTMTGDGRTVEPIAGPDRSTISPGDPTGRMKETGTTLIADLVRPDGDGTAGRDMVVTVVVTAEIAAGGKEEILMTGMKFRGFQNDLEADPLRLVAMATAMAKVGKAKASILDFERRSHQRKHQRQSQVQRRWRENAGQYQPRLASNPRLFTIRTSSLIPMSRWITR